ncbi:pentapeptide repeat-containing protein [Capilliphycus salinus ALCB114379]|uniref:pentapeptide repeat-containing protein n=1 Tax=Capilliphycus salinus TaxID=2768948 RepID=UPI0039A53D03
MTNGCKYNDYQAESYSGAYPTIPDPELDQEVIYQFFIQCIRQWEPQDVLDEFENIFIHLSCPDSLRVVEAITNIIESKQEFIFINTLKRVCYILINNWYINRKHQYVQKLIDLLEETQEDESIAIDQNLNRLGNWLRNFFNSAEYQTIKNCALKSKKDWSHRYTSYLLVPEYIDNDENSKEQKEFARNLSKQLKDKYKFDLAMYVARSNSTAILGERRTNPTQLGDEVIQLIKKTISTQRISSYTQQAKLFLRDTQDLNYAEFKKALPEYLMIANNAPFPINKVREKLIKKLDFIYTHYEERTINKGLIIRTCNRLIETLTTEDNKTPSPIFTLLTTHGNPLTLVIMLLKIVLICSAARTYLELCISKLIQQYQDYEEHQCQRLIHFLEVFNLVFTIFTENVQFHLVKVPERQASPLMSSLDSYQVFCQSKGPDLRGTNLKGVNLSSLELRGADLRDSDLSEIELVQIDLRLANLSGVNLSGAILDQSQLLVANISEADLSHASLLATDLRRADLSRTNLTNANLTKATLDLANLRQAKLTHANLVEASLNATDLSDADLCGADLQNVNLRGANLTGVNLSYANLKGANLQDANLAGANLSGVNLSHVDLSHANLSNANLEATNLYRVNFTHANLSAANLKNANLSEANLRSANLSYANLNSAILRRANLNRAVIIKAQICNADLTRAKLIEVELSEANLAYAQIRHANLTNAKLFKTNLRGANLFGSNVIDAIVKEAKFGNNSGLSDDVRRCLKLRQ